MRRTSGFSLIEVMVTLVLTTIGILGMVAMQGRSIQYTQDSAQRNTAIMLANELVEIIRANPDEVFKKTPPKEPIYSGFKDTSLFYKDKGSDFDTAPTNCVANPTSAIEMRDCWVQAVEASLPGAATLLESTTYICRSSSREPATTMARWLKFSWPGQSRRAPALIPARPTPPPASTEPGWNYENRVHSLATRHFHG